MWYEKHSVRRWLVVAIVVMVALSLAAVVLAASVTDGADVKVINDNNNVDGGVPNPSFDAANRQQNETTVDISPADPDIVAAGGNDYRMVPVFGDGWMGVYVSDDGGATWFNTMVPGFPSDTSPEGLASPLLGLDGSGDPVVRFDDEGNLYVGGIAFNRDFDQEDKNNDTVAYIARYDYTPGTPGGVSTPNSAANPPNFTYAYTTIVDQGAIGFAIPAGQPYGFAGVFDDKNWMGVDTYPDSPCYGTVYFSYTKFAGVGGPALIQFARSTDGGAMFNEPQPIAQKGKDGVIAGQGSNIGIAPDGRVYVSYRTFATNSDPQNRIQVVSSNDCGKHFGKPVTAAVFAPMPRNVAGLTFRTPTEPWIAVSDVDPNELYVAYMGMNGDNADVFVARSSDGGYTWSAPAVVNDDGTQKHQFWPTIDVSDGVLHAAWYDFRDSGSPGDPAADNNALNVYYAYSADGSSFSPNQAITDIPHNPNCLMFGGGTVGFHGDYIELDAAYVGGEHLVNVVWTDNRDVAPCDLDPQNPQPTNSTGNRNQNIYSDRLIVIP